jgi:thiol-disulfide isomerase/thioredoxin
MKGKKRIITWGIFWLALARLPVPAQAGLTAGGLEDSGALLRDGGERFPFEGLVTAGGDAFDGSSLRGKYVLVVLWSTWCPYCDRENQSLQELYERYGGGGFTVVTVSLGEEAETVKEYMDAKGYSFPVLMDREEKLKERYAPRRPHSYLLDREGYIVAEAGGDKDWTGEEALSALGRLIPGFGRREGL